MNTNLNLSPRIATILGALIADSASLGLHWLYDPERIAEIETTAGLVFLTPDAKAYIDTTGFFAHVNKVSGDSSGYGEVGLLLLKHIAKHGEFNHTAYQTEYCAHFGPGGAYIGYIDAPTRLTLRTLLPLKPENFPTVSGADDDQFAALAAVPILVANHYGSQQDLLKHVEAVVRITNDNKVAVAAACCSAVVLFERLQGKPMAQALQYALPFAGEKLTPLLEQALAYQTLDSIAVAKQFGSACHVVEGLPLIFHIAQHASNYRNAIVANIRAGGDSCGRAMMLGAIMAAYQVNGKDKASSIPMTWFARYRQLTTAADACLMLDESNRNKSK